MAGTQTPTDNGFHGEAKAPLAGVPLEQTRTEVAQGRTITVEEESGVAAAEAAGNIGTDADPDGDATAGSG